MDRKQMAQNEIKEKRYKMKTTKIVPIMLILALIESIGAVSAWTWQLPQIATTVDSNGNGYINTSLVNLTVTYVPNVGFCGEGGCNYYWSFNNMANYPNSIMVGAAGNALIVNTSNPNASHTIQVEAVLSNYHNHGNHSVIAQMENSWSMEVSPNDNLSLWVVDNSGAGYEYVSACQEGSYASGGLYRTNYIDYNETSNTIYFKIYPYAGGTSCQDTVNINHVWVGTGTGNLRIGQDQNAFEPADISLRSLKINNTILDILSYYRSLGKNPNVVETTDLLKAADDWSRNIAPPGFSTPITTQQLLILADEWSKGE
jgi:hypothetical protein